MLGDYLKYNAGPVDWIAPPKKSDRTGSSENKNKQKQRSVPDYASTDDEEDGYDPYNHPIERRILEKHLHKMR